MSTDTTARERAIQQYKAWEAKHRAALAPVAVLLEADGWDDPGWHFFDTGIALLLEWARPDLTTEDGSAEVWVASPACNDELASDPRWSFTLQNGYTGELVELSLPADTAPETVAATARLFAQHVVFELPEVPNATV